MYKQLGFDIDPDDIPHLALAMYIPGRLCTGGKKLTNGWVKKGYEDIVNTTQLAHMLAR